MELWELALKIDNMKYKEAMPIIIEELQKALNAKKREGI